MLLATTKTDAVNVMLSSLGYAPVNDIDTDTDIDVANAIRMLDRFSRDIQRQGWDFNKVTMTLTPDLATHRILFDNMLISWKARNGKTYVKRGDYLFDASRGTFEIYSAIVIDAIVAVDFEVLPDCFKNYVTARAAEFFQTRYMGDTNVSQDLQLEAAEAWRDIVAYDMSMGEYNMLQLTGVADTLTRS